MGYQETEHMLNGWVRELKTTWQVLIIGVFVFYGIGLYQYFNQQPEIRASILPYFKILDIASLIIALILTGTIYVIKKKYFSLRAVRLRVQEYLQENNDSDKQIISRVLQLLRSKLILVWILGSLLIIEGVVFFWVTYSSNNMHIYFIVGLFSLFLNYPRKELVLDLPYILKEERKQFST